MILVYDDPGSWEFVAATIYWDGMYQRGLRWLEHVLQLQLQSKNEMKSYVNAFHETTNILGKSLNASLLHGASSYMLSDLLKNTAIAYQRYHKVIQVLHPTYYNISTEVRNTVERDYLRIVATFTEKYPKAAATIKVK